MKNFGGHVGVAFFGILSFAITVALVTAIDRATGFNLFALSVWVVVPVGAALTGAAAASGYYFGSLLFHTRPNWFLLVQVMIVAALAQFAIYYAEYSTLVLDNGIRVADRIGFFDYLDIRLTTAHMRIGRAQTDTGAVGSFGYWLAFFQFVGFILGGIATYLILKNHPVCTVCSRYPRKLATSSQHFNDREAFATYYDNLFDHPVDGPAFAEWMGHDPDKGRIREGTILATSTLRGCPHCKTQRIVQAVQIMGKNDWSALPSLARDVIIPQDIDLRPVFKGETGRRIGAQPASA
ncbi:hypothetical protein [Bosea sp. 2RAB26]|uniref:hypothetical protein n=1 Tax=Bosea sp. 2RAB26 TaxID=3237476 RepID=UPI003F923E43